MNQRMDAEGVIRRLKRIEGQVRGVAKMVGEDKPCEDILIQISSIKAALHKVGQYVLEGHLHRCILDGIQEGGGDEVLDKVSGALEQFSRLV
jgi:DNA-binding FrmR family transcriptional regulator